MPATGPTRPLPITDPDELRAALGGQGERERLVLELRYGLADGRRYSLARIGQRLGLSAERVRQLETRALERLRSPEPGPPGPQAVRRGTAIAPAATASSEATTSFESPGMPARQRFLRPWTLLLLWLKPSHGADVKQRLHELGMPGADYRSLRGLEAQGLLRSAWAPGEGIGPDRRVYSLTEAGLEQLDRDAEALAKVADTLAMFFERRAGERAQ